MHGGELFTKSRGTRGTLERKYFAAIYESNIPIYCHQCKPQTFKLHPGISEVARPLFIQTPGRHTAGSRKLSNTDITYFRRYSRTRYFVELLAWARKKKRFPVRRIGRSAGCRLYAACDDALAARSSTWTAGGERVRLEHRSCRFAVGLRQTTLDISSCARVSEAAGHYV